MIGHYKRHSLEFFSNFPNQLTFYNFLLPVHNVGGRHNALHRNLSHTLLPLWSFLSLATSPFSLPLLWLKSSGLKTLTEQGSPNPGLLFPAYKSLSWKRLRIHWIMQAETNNSLLLTRVLHAVSLDSKEELSWHQGCCWSNFCATKVCSNDWNR